MKTINNKNNSFIKHLVKLRKDSKYRNEKKAVLVMGKKIVSALLKKKIIKTIISTDKSIKIKHSNIIFVSADIMKKITNLPSAENIAAEVSLPLQSNLIDQKKNFSKLLVLDKIQDPGNLGTLIRTAQGLNFDGVVLTPNTVDPYNDKALRSAKGATFFIPLFFESTQNLSELITQKKYFALLAHTKGTKIEKVSFSFPLMLILSSESHGIAPWTKEIKNKVSIPTKENKDIDSLNVAISGAILMYLITDKKGDLTIRT